MNKAGFATVNPSTAEEIETFSYFTPAQTEEVIARADKSFQSFRKLSVHKRTKHTRPMHLVEAQGFLPTAE